jgi:precorrin-8X/cobalt-precorrin-8 methylmutase
MSKLTLEGEEIERESFRIIGERVMVPPPERDVVLRVIHATADFDYADLLVFHRGPVEAGIRAIRDGCDILTDVTMVQAGINKKGLERFGGEVKCFVGEEEVQAFAEEEGITRSRAAFRLRQEEVEGNIVAIGNAPTALFEVSSLIRAGCRPRLVVGVPVGFVGAAESKEEILQHDVPGIVVRGRKGGSTIAVSIINALIQLAGNDD